MVGVGGCANQHSNGGFVTDLSPSLESRWPETQDEQLERTVLSREIPAMKFTAEPLGNVLQQLEKQAGIAIDVDWKKLETIGTLPTSPVTFMHGSATLGFVISSVCRAWRRIIPRRKPWFGMGNLSYPHRSHLTIRSSNLYGSMTCATWWTWIMMSSRHPRSILPPSHRPRGLRQRLRGADGGLFSQTRPANPVVPEAPYPHISEADLCRYIIASVAPETWRDNGGAGSVRILFGQLVVNQSEFEQRKVRALLVDLAADHLKIVRVYDVRPLLRRGWGTDREKMDRLKHLIVATVSPVGSYPFASMGKIDDFDGRIYISAPLTAQLRAERILRNCLGQ